MAEKRPSIKAIGRIESALAVRSDMNGEAELAMATCIGKPVESSGAGPVTKAPRWRELWGMCR